jgi:hypothetical protein
VSPPHHPPIPGYYFSPGEVVGFVVVEAVRVSVSGAIGIGGGDDVSRRIVHARSDARHANNANAQKRKHFGHPRARNRNRMLDDPISSV